MKYSKFITIGLIVLILSSIWLSISNFDSKENQHIGITNRIDLHTVESGETEITKFRTNELNDKIVRTVEEETQELQITNSVDTVAEDYNEGDWRLFWAPDLTNYDDGYEFYEVNATLRAIGSHTLIYHVMSDTDPIPTASIVAMNNTFENIIYPQLTDFFGLPLDIDTNDKIIILIFDILDGGTSTSYVAGFFYALNEYLNSDLHPSQRYSNEAELINLDGVEGHDSIMDMDYDTIAHELQHLIHYGVDENEHLWFEEGASMFAEYLIGEDPFEISTPYKSRFQSNPDKSLTYWDYYNLDGSLINYGASYAFYLYLAEHYGGADFIQTMVGQSSDGIESIEDTFTALGTPLQFKEIFRNWTIANYLDDTSFAGGSYGYYNTSLSMSVESFYNYAPIPRTENSVPYWGTDYLEFEIPIELPFNLEFQGSTAANFLLSVILSNTTTLPLNTEVFPVSITTDNVGSFSTEDLNYIADEITLVISSYPKTGTPDHDDEYPAPAQTYWFMINPEGISISPGNIIFVENGIQLINITVFDSNGFEWQEAEGSIWELYTVSGNYTELTGTLVYNSQLNYWESSEIDISLLPEGEYRFKYYFYNTTATGVAYSNSFSISSLSTTTTTTGSPIPGFLAVLSILALAGIKIKRE